jgi:outer membrane protein OmpA-like peptidoglycan-associated protein
MRTMIPVVLALNMLAMVACTTSQTANYGTGRLSPAEINAAGAMFGQALTDESVANAVITQRTVFPYHFVSGTTALTELGIRDLQILAAHFKKYPPTEGEIVVNEVVKNYKVFFDFDEATIRAEDEAVLKEAASVLQKYPDDHVLITGNTDARGTEEYNIQLGGRRAEAVREDLLAKDIESSRIQIISRGEYDAIRAESDVVEDMQADRNAHFLVAEVVTDIKPAQVRLNMRQETASRALYLARRESVTDFLVSQGIERDMIAIDDAPAGGDGMAAHRVLAVVSEAKAGQRSGGGDSEFKSGSSSSRQSDNTNSTDGE